MKKELKGEAAETNQERAPRNERREERRMMRRRRDPGSVVWGVMFIFAGIIFLLNNTGVIPWSMWNVLLQFWPVLLVFLGLQIILGDGILASLLIGVLAILVFGSIFAFALRESGSPLFYSLGLSQIPWMNIFNYLRIR